MRAAHASSAHAQNYINELMKMAVKAYLYRNVVEMRNASVEMRNIPVEMRKISVEMRSILVEMRNICAEIRNIPVEMTTFEMMLENGPNGPL